MADASIVRRELGRLAATCQNNGSDYITGAPTLDL
jgi:hypothetical protein